MLKRIGNLYSYFISIISIFVLLATTVIFFGFNPHVFFFIQSKITLFNKPINEYIGISLDTLKSLYINTFDFLKSHNYDQSIIYRFFNDKELTHLKDIQLIYSNLKTIYLICLLILLISFILILLKKININRYLNCFKNVIFFTLIVFLILGLYAIVDFNGFWTMFHHFLFTNDLWLLSYSTDVLLMMMPENLFFILVLCILFIFVLLVFIYYRLLDLLRKKI